MAADYGQVRTAFIEARMRALPARLLAETTVQPEQEWDPLQFPTWWAWMCETAEAFVFWVERGDALGRDLAASTWNRLEFCKIRAGKVDARHVLVMVAEMELGTARWAEMFNGVRTGSLEYQAREMVAQLGCRVLDELAAELELGE